jgi:hypothetical protein
MGPTRTPALFECGCLEAPRHPRGEFTPPRIGSRLAQVKQGDDEATRSFEHVELTVVFHGVVLQQGGMAHGPVE